ncbi:MAG: M43 family zinc metalloprotease [Bacteroidota bacterium]
MIRKITLLFLACLGMTYASTAQYCGFDYANQHLQLTNPEYAQKVIQMKNNWVNTMTNIPQQLLVYNTTSNVYEIPVVIHVIHTGGAIGTVYNPSVAQLTGMISYLNQVFAANYAGYPQAGSGGTFIPIRFALALRDSTCAATTGIDRINGTTLVPAYSNGVNNGSGIGITELALKNMSRWPTSQYYNIWVVNKIDGQDGTAVGVPFTPGFAHLPPAPSTLDGMVILASQAVAGNTTVPHEMAHAFSVLHTFNGGNATMCPANNNCLSDGDQICDTEPEKQSTFNCPTDPNPCTGLSYNNVQNNFMDYSSCQNRFTPGQRDRMLWGLMTYRSDLIGSLGSTAPAAAVTVACIPTSTTPTNTIDAGPREVKLSDVNYSYLDFVSGGYNTDGNSVYIDKTCRQQATLISDSAYTLTVKTGPNPELVRVYIDYNSDGVFAANELVYIHNGTMANELHVFDFTVPDAVSMPGIRFCVPLRMRVVSDVVNAPLPPTACGPLSTGQAEDYAIIIKGSGPAAGAGTVAISLYGGNPSCIGSTISFSATPSIGVINPTYKWLIGGVPNGVTTSTFTTSSISTGSVVSCRMFYVDQCGGLDSVTSSTIVVTRTAASVPALTIATTTGTNPGCPNQTYTFTATPTSGGIPTYQWSVNGVAVIGATGQTFTSNTLVAGNTVTCQATTFCPGVLSATSNTITIATQTVTPTALIALTTGNNPGCSEQVYTFTVQSTNAGTTPTYQWQVNGVNAGTNSSTFSSSLNNNDVVTCNVTASGACALPSMVTSNGIVIHQQGMISNVTLAVTAGTNPACSGKPLTFMAQTLNAGTNPTYQWFVNNSAVAGATSNVYTSTTYQMGDQVFCRVTSSDLCVLNPVDSSNVVTVTTVPTLIPTVDVAITQGSNPGCLGNLTEFTATGHNVGTAPQYVWYVNGVPVSNGTVYASTGILDGDVVSCHVMMTDGACYTQDTIISTPDTMSMYLTPLAPLVSLVNGQLVTNATGIINWYGPNGIIIGANGDHYTPVIPGYYYATVSNAGCSSPSSNLIQIVILGVENINTDAMRIFPNPTNGQITFDWGATSVNVRIDIYNVLGQKVADAELHNEARKTLDLSAMTNGNYFVVIRDENGKSGTVKISLKK